MAVETRPKQFVPRSLLVENFIAVNKAEVNFESTLTEIRGPNGSGKTSTVRAIEFLLCGTVHDDGGSRIHTDRLKHYGEDIEVLMAWDGPNGEFQVRRQLGSKHTVEVLEGDAEIWRGIPVREWPLECTRLFGTGPEEIRALLRSDRFIKMAPREQASLAAGLLGIEVEAADLLETFPEELRELVWPLMNVTKTGAELIGDLHDAAVAARKIRKRDRITMEGRVEAADVLLDTRQAELAALQATFASEDEAREMLTDFVSQIGRRKAAEASIVVAQDRITEVDRDATSVSGQVTDLREQADREDAQEKEWQDRQSMFTGRISDAAAEHGRCEMGLNEAEAMLATAREDMVRLNGAFGVRKTLLGFALHQVEASATEGSAFADDPSRCPLCNSTDVDWGAVLETITAENKAAEIEMGNAMAAVDTADDAVRNWQSKLGNARTILREATAERDAEATPPRNGDDTRGQIAPLQRRRREFEERRAEAVSHLNEKRLELEALETPEDIEEERTAINLWLEANHNVELAQADRQGAREQRDNAEAAVLTAETIADLCTPEVLMGVAVGDGMETLVEILNRILAAKGWTVEVQPDMQCIITVPGMTIDPDMLSSGERLYLGAAWQAAFAHYLGIGLITLDDGALLDGVSFNDLTATLYDMYTSGPLPTETRCAITRVSQGEDRSSLRVMPLKTGAAVESAQT